MYVFTGEVDPSINQRIILRDDTATLIGTDNGETLSVADLAAMLQTTPHEITTCLTARVPRLPVNA